MRNSEKLFPNPVDEHITFYNPNEAEISAINIYNLQGAKCFHQAIFHKHPSFQVDLTGLSSGIYMVRLQLKGGEEIHRLIVE